MEANVLDPQFDKILYPDSPFVPSVTTDSAYRIMAMVTLSGYPPTVAIAQELIELFTRHNQTLIDQEDWLMEKFPVDEDSLNFYFFGLILPPGLILAADMINDSYTEKETLDTLFPLTDHPILNNLRDYVRRQIPLTGKYLQKETSSPTQSAVPIYKQCTFDILSDSPWYLLGLEASKRTFLELAKLH